MINSKYRNLEATAAAFKSQYSEASPFPHIVIKDFFDNDLIEKILEEFPDLAMHVALKKFSKNSNKYASKGEAMFGEHTRHFCHFLNSQPFLEFLQELTAIERTLIPDPYLIGGGLHEIKNGGYLDIHADFNKHHSTGLDRRINVLVYLNKNWTKEKEGYLELWDRQAQQCEVKIAPVFNTLVVFTTTSDSFHGHPESIVCKSSESRKSIAMYYYTNGRPENETSAKGEVHSTLYRQTGRERNVVVGKKIIKAITPPVIISIFKKLLGNNN